MAFLDAAHSDTPAVFDPDRNQLLGLALSAALPLAAVFAVAGLTAFLGLSAAVPLYADPVRALLFIPLFPLWGAAHWFAARQGAAGRAASRWVLALIGWGLVLPFAHGLLDPYAFGWVTLFSVLLIGATALRVSEVSRPALLLLLPSLVWVVLAAIPGYVLVTSGWSPGFAVTLALGESENG
jgi:hypothetical protein